MPGVAADIPVNTPVSASISATGGLALLHRPPVDVVLITVDEPSHTWNVPVIGSGRPFTVTVFIALQPDPKVYVTVITPLLSPVSTPEATSIEPIAGLLLLHVPPGVAQV